MGTALLVKKFKVFQACKRRLGCNIVSLVPTVGQSIPSFAANNVRSSILQVEELVSVVQKTQPGLIL